MEFYPAGFDQSNQRHSLKAKLLSRDCYWHMQGEAIGTYVNYYYSRLDKLNIYCSVSLKLIFGHDVTLD